MIRTVRYSLFAAFTAALVAQARAGDDKGFKPLFNGKDLTGWKTELKKDDKHDPAKAIVVKRLEGMTIDAIALEVNRSRRTVIRVLGKVQEQAAQMLENAE